ncbi:MAG: amino acid dehydrogenase [Bacteroidetes bacterium]|nr:amino acid dehydrogenase [Bacteroidota bacterium]
MLELLKKFENQSPEIVFEWNDAPTGAKGWMVINSLRGGAAGGGTRMREGLDRNEVLSLAKTMEIKFAVSGPNIGGAKSGINFDPSDPRKEEVLRRWYKALMPILKTYYGTGGDLNVEEVKEVIPITHEFGLMHPQEGVLMGHFSPTPEDRLKIIEQLQKGVSRVITDERYSPNLESKYTVSDMITGWGVAEAVRHYYDLWKGETLADKRAIIQGWGNVASAAGYYLAQNGVKIVGIIDRHGGLINEEGCSMNVIRQLYMNKHENTLVVPNMLPYGSVNDRIWDVPADIFIPGASSRLVTKDNLKRMKDVRVISCGANVPFADPEIFFGATAAYADENFAVVADFIANCGMARVFAYLMQPNAILTDEAIFTDVSETIRKTMVEVKDKNPTLCRLMETSFEVVLGKLLK